MSNGIVYVNVGRRDNSILEASLQIVRFYQPEIPITIYSDVDLPFLDNTHKIELKHFDRVKYNDREENRNSSLWRLKALRESKYDNTCYLDNDIFLTHPGFFEGLRIAEHYGICMVENPRYFISTMLPMQLNIQENLGDMDIGVDVQPHDREFTKDMPKYMTALNMVLCFIVRNQKIF